MNDAGSIRIDVFNEFVDTWLTRIKSEAGVKVALLILHEQELHNRPCDLTLDEMAARVGISRRSVLRGLQEGCGSGMLRRLQSAGNSALYVVNIPVDCFPEYEPFTTAGWLYVIGAYAVPGLYKIGITTGDLNTRLATNQTGSPVELHIQYSVWHENAADLEQRLHTFFIEMGKHSHLEWFNLTPGDLYYIVSLAEAE